jgi:hypothetical protein
MNVKPVDGMLREAVGQRTGDQALPTSYRQSPLNVTEAVLAAYAKACRDGGRTAQSAFDIAVRTYLARFPGTHANAAARIVADIISHRS